VIVIGISLRTRLEVLQTQREFTDDIRVIGQRFLYGHGIQSFRFVGFASSLYAALPVALTIVHFDGTPIHSNFKA